MITIDEPFVVVVAAFDDGLVTTELSQEGHDDFVSEVVFVLIVDSCLLF